MIMDIEHFALNVKDPVEMAKWYVEHLGMKIMKKRDQAPFTTFLSDSGDNVLLEIYRNPESEVPDYPNMNPLVVHLAFSDDDPDATKTRLTAARATCVEEINLPDGSRLIMMRDPWGLAIQFCKRSSRKA
jgi:catechol 2,3-dioxygenase-like lactoylglutathione lyase family enzyme